MKKYLLLIIISFGFFACTSKKADMIIYNGNIYTVNDLSPIVSAVAVKDGKISSIYIVTEGENYPVSDQPELAIVDVNIINPGQNYVDGDTVTDNFGNEYDVKIQNGAITKVRPITTIAVDAVPQLRVRSSTGVDALLVANIDERPDYQGEVKEVIDCIS